MKFHARDLLPTVLVLLTGVLLMMPRAGLAQQARGLFFSVLGPDVPAARGDYNNAQVLFIDIPHQESQPVYLRIFDADTGGYLDQREGSRYTAQTRYMLIGGPTAASLHDSLAGAPQPVSMASYPFAAEDIIHDQTLGAEPRLDGRYMVLGELPADRGSSTPDGFRRYAFIAYATQGDDANYFDYVLSYDPNDKVPPTGVRMFAYDLTLRTPAETDFEGQIRIPVQPETQIQLAGFGLGNAVSQLKIPFRDDLRLPVSTPGEWTYIPAEIPQGIEQVGFNFSGITTVNTFSFMVLQEDNTPLKLPLPIPDYQPATTPRISFEASYPDSLSCQVFALQSVIVNGDDFLNPETMWIFDADTLTGSAIQRTFTEPGYHPFTMKVSGLFEGARQSVLLHDSLRVNQPPYAWAGGDRQFIAGTPIVFDGTVSEDPDGQIIRYHWDFGDGTSGTGARVDHTYGSPGQFTVTLTVTDNSGSPCASQTATATVRMNESPLAVINAPDAAQNGDVILLDASASTDPDGEITEFRWEVNGETVSSEPVVSYALTSDRNLAVTLTVTDDSFAQNATSTARHAVRVSNGPVANAGADKHISPNRPPVFNGNRSRADEGRIVRYEWTFPDGTVREGMTVRQAIADPGDYYVYLTVTDSFGLTDRDSLYVRVNTPPVPVITGNRVVYNEPVQLNALDSFDPDGELISYEWYMGDGTRIAGPTAEHRYRSPGEYTVRLIIVDDSGTFSSVQSVDEVVRVLEEAPVAVVELPEVEESPAVAVSPREDTLVTADESAQQAEAQETDGEEDEPTDEERVTDETQQRSEQAQQTGDIPTPVQPEWTVAPEGLDWVTMQPFDAYMHVETAPSPVLAALEFNRAFADAEAARLAEIARAEEAVEAARLAEIARAEEAAEAARLAEIARAEEAAEAARLAEIARAEEAAEAEQAEELPDTEPEAPAPPEAVTVREETITALESRLSGIYCVSEPLNLPAELGVSPSQFHHQFETRLNEELLTTAQSSEISFENQGRQHLVLTRKSGDILLDTRFEAYPVPRILAEVPREHRMDENNTIMVFDASPTLAASDVDLRFFWEFGDGTTAAGQRVRHRYSQPGNYTVTLTAFIMADTPCETVVRDFQVSVIQN